MSSIREVSRVAGVSIATVSRALSTPEKVSKKSLRKVQEAVEKVHYRPNMMARNFRAARSHSIVVLVPNLANLHFATVIRSLEEEAHKNGYSVLLGDTGGSEERDQEYMNLVETRQADGAIQLLAHAKGAPPPPDHIAIVNACGAEDTPYACVRIDNAEASKTVVDYLISLGHRRIGVISGLKSNPHSIDRLKGYTQALSNAGIPFDANIVVEGDFTIASGPNAANHFAAMKNRPTALFCMNDEMAIAAIQGLRNHDIKIPEEMSITGFDDIEFSRISDPPLTTVSQPAKEIGKVAMRTLLKKINGEGIAQETIVLPHELIVRKSTALAQKQKG